MPKDKSGKFHLNTQRAQAADKAPAKSEATHKMPDGSEMKNSEMPSASHTTLHDHGDGTYHTESHDGHKVEHPHIGHALAHMGAKHAGGKHMHVHHDGMSYTSHHADESGNVQGPNEHDSMDSVKDEMDGAMGDGESQDKESYNAGDEGLSGL